MHNDTISETITQTITDRTELFAHLADPATAARFFEQVADDVSWTVEGTHPLAGHYASRTAFTTATFDRLGPLMRDGVRLEVVDLHVAGDVTVAELHATSTTLDGAPSTTTTAGSAGSTPPGPTPASSRSGPTSTARWSRGR